MPTNQLSRIIATTDLGDVDNYVGQPGTIFWDTASSTIRVSDGATAGGVAVGGGASLGYLALPSRNDTQFTIGGGGTLDGIQMTTDRGTVKFGNTPECVLTGNSHFHIMKQDPTLVDLFFGDDSNYVKLPTTGGVTVQSQGTDFYTWHFGADGVLNFPNNNGQIGQLESPYTGLEFRTGSGSDWIGISYGEINDNNTSYFYFDKDGSDYTTANHRAHLQIKNPAHDGHVEWLFDSDGNLTLPLDSKINSGGVSVPNSAEIGTTVVFDGPDIVDSEVYMGSGYGEFRSIFNKVGAIESGLVYAGVEGFNYVQQGDVNFTGMVSQTPNINSMYSVKLNDQGQIVLGFTQAGQTQASTDWSVVVGTLTTDYTVNGLFANTTTTVIGSGSSNWQFGSDGNLTFPVPSNTTAITSVGYLGLPQHNLSNSTYTLDFPDMGQHIYMTHDSPQTITIPANTDKSFPVGATIAIITNDSSTATITITTDTLTQLGTGSTGSRTLGANSMATLIKVAANQWVISGVGLS